MKRLMRCAPGRSSSPATNWTIRLNLNGSERFPVCVGRPLMVLGAQRTRFQTEFRGAGSGCSGDSDAGSSIQPVESLLVGPSGSASQGRTLPSLLLPPLPRVSLAVAPLGPGSKPSCPQACLTSTPTLGSGVAAVPCSAEASPACTVRAPGVGPAAGSVPQVCILPCVALHSGWSCRDLCVARRCGHQRAAAQ